MPRIPYKNLTISDELAEKLDMSTAEIGLSVRTTNCLEERGIFTIPDILCNAGGVYVSYLEYSQETQQEQMSEEEVQSRLDRRMREKFQLVCETARQRKLTMRQAAMYIALHTVCSALQARGFLS